MIIKLTKKHGIGINKNKNIAFDLNENIYNKYLIEDSDEVLLLDEIYNNTITTYKLQHMQTVKDTLIFNIIDEIVVVENKVSC